MIAAGAIRVLVVDDSAFARKVIRECLTAAGVDVVGIAHDGLEALEMIADLAPDVVTLDLVMPNLDGLGVLNALAGKHSPQMVVVATCDAESASSIAACREGGFRVVEKPTSLTVSELYDIGEPLVEAVKAAAAAIPHRAAAQAAAPVTLSTLTTTRKVLVIGASTGGPQALTHLVSSLPANFPLPIAVVLHIPPGYTAAIASRLAARTELEVIEAAEGVVMQPGRVVIARAGRHLRLVNSQGQMRCKLDVLPHEAQHRPSVDILFQSAADLAGPGALGVVLTGMGSDGLAGARAIHAAGGAVLTEAASSCVIYGMPRAVREAGLSAGEAPLERMVEEIIRFL